MSSSLQTPATQHHANGAPPARVTVTTPRGWRKLSLSDIADRTAAGLLDDERLDELGAGAPAMLSKLVSSISDETNIFFAALSIPGEDGCTDLTSLTLALPTQRANESTSSGSLGAEADAPGANLGNQADVQPEDSYESVVLRAGPAARTESIDFVVLGAPLPSLPVFCVEYALPVPYTDRALIVTFTTVAPSDTDSLRAQFADIAATLAFD